MPNLGIVYHFKKTDVHSPNDNGCWVPADNSYPTDGISILRAQCTRFLRALRALLEETPFLSEYVVGIDAASQELKAEPWIYAPVYRFARSRENTLPLNSSTRMPMQSLGLTYHVGEDYHHILTGLRHIDEVITYFGYKPGDRLGHATALHVDLEASVYKGYKRDKIEMRGDRAEMSDFPLYLNTVAGGLDCRNQAIGGFSFVVKIYALPVVEIIGQFLYLLGRYGFDAQIGYCF